jgi:hypothetical protein
LVRYADDLLLLCRDSDEAVAAHNELARLARSAGIPFKKTTGNVAVDLETGEAITWLGYRLAKGHETLRATIGGPSWSRLALALDVANTKPESPLRAVAAVRGWLEQLGPCFPGEHTSQTLARVRDLAAERGFEELPSNSSLSLRWQHAHERFLQEAELETAQLVGNLQAAAALAS